MEGSLFQRVLRYNVYYFDASWNEHENLRKTLVTANEMYDLCRAFHCDHLAFMRGPAALGSPLQHAVAITVEAEYVEV